MPASDGFDPERHRHQTVASLTRLFAALVALPLAASGAWAQTSPLGTSGNGARLICYKCRDWIFRGPNNAICGG